MLTLDKKTNSFLHSRTVIVIVVFVLIAIPILILFFRHTPSSPSVIDKPTVASYNGSNYTFSYPTGWKESESGVPEGSGQVVYLQPPTANPSIKPHVLIKVTPATAKAVAANNEVYVILKYKKTEEEVNGTPAQKYSNVLQSEHGPLHSIAYVFQKNGNLYLVELGYTQTAADPQLENEFNQLVTSFVIEK